MNMKPYFTLTLGLSALLLAGCTKHDAVSERPTPVEVQTVQAFSGKDEKRFSAVIQPYERVDLSFRVGGYVESIAQVPGIAGHKRSLQDGDRVERGTVLAHLHSAEYGARVTQAQGSLSEAETLLAKAEYDRTRATKLFASQSMTKPDYDAAMANYEANAARVKSARGKLSEAASSSNDTVLRAPFAGTILKRNIAMGTLAAPGVTAFVVADTGVVKAIFGVPDKLIPQMKIGKTLSLKADAFLDSELQGRITRVSASADPQSRVFEVEVSIPNAKDELKVGMITTLVVDDIVPELGSPVVPIAALVSSTKRQGGYAVYATTTSAGKTIARLAEVEVGRTLGNLVVINSGPRIGEAIVTSGAGLLHDGEPIEIRTTSAVLGAQE
jgi:RND family efflux transporter MFP subunit